MTEIQRRAPASSSLSVFCLEMVDQVYLILVRPCAIAYDLEEVIANEDMPACLCDCLSLCRRVSFRLSLALSLPLRLDTN